MASMSLPIHSYKLRSTPASPARLVNVFPEPLPPDAKSRLIISRAHGVASLAAVGNGPIRGMHEAFGTRFVVSGTALYKVAADGTATNLGAVGSGEVSMADNGTYLVVVTNPDAYYTDGTASVTQITDADFTSRGASKVKFVDNYMIFLEPDTGRFFCADLGSVTDFNALDFATAEGSPDLLVGMEVEHRQVILLGEKSVEIFENVGGSGFPFERAIGGFAEIGCFGGNTVAKIDNSVVWVANDFSVRKLIGNTPQRISDYAVEQFLSGADVSTGIAYAYHLDGHAFYVLCYSTGCWVWDATTGQWHERSSYPEDYYRWQYHCNVDGTQYVGDAYSNKVGYFDPTTYAEYGDIQRAEWTYQTVYSEHKRAFHDRLEVVMETGVGLVTGQGSDPELMMEFSDDGGLTWESLPNKKIGMMGEYLHRPFWNALGSARQRVYRGAISDPIRVTISDTTLEARGGRV
jgi:hypothetical protein